MNSTKTYHVRWMIRKDMADILKIENLFSQYNWNENDYIFVLRKRNTIGLIVEDYDDTNRGVLASMVYELHQDRLQIIRFISAEPAKDNEAVDELLKKLIGKLSIDRRTRIKIVIPETNLELLDYFKNNNFRAMKILKSHFDEFEDGFVMQYQLLPDGGTF